MMGIWWLWGSGLAWLLWVEKLTAKRFSTGIIWASSLMVGVIVNAWIMLLLNLIMGGWQRIWLQVSLGLWILISIGVNRSRVGSFVKESLNFRLWSKPGSLVAILILGQSLFLGYSQLSNEFLHSDAVFWYLRGRLLYEAKGITVASLTHPVFGDISENSQQQEVLTMFRYPLLVPLVIAGVHFMDQPGTVVAVKSVWFALYLSMLLYMAVMGGVIFGERSWWRVVPIVVMMATPVVWRWFTPDWFGFADIWLAGFYLMGLGGLYLWVKTSKIAYLYLGAWLLGGALFTKIEGLATLSVLIPIGIIVYQKKQWWPGLVASLMVVAMSAGWYVYSGTLKVPNDELTMLVGRAGMWQQLIARSVQALELVTKELGNISNYLLLWPAAALLLVSRLMRGKLTNWLWLYLLPLAGWGVIWVSYIFSPLELTGLVYSTLARLYVQWVPAVILLSAIVVAELIHQPEIS